MPNNCRRPTSVDHLVGAGAKKFLPAVSECADRLIQDQGEVEAANTRVRELRNSTRRPSFIFLHAKPKGIFFSSAARD